MNWITNSSIAQIQGTIKSELGEAVRGKVYAGKLKRYPCSRLYYASRAAYLVQRGFEPANAPEPPPQAIKPQS